MFVFKAQLQRNLKDVNIELLESEGFQPVMNPVFINAYRDEERTQPIREVNWKLKCLKPGSTSIRVRIFQDVLEKSLEVGDQTRPLSNRRLARSTLSHFIYPAERLLDNPGPVHTLSLKYPPKLVSVLGLKIHWLIIHLILVVVFVLALRKRFGVEF
jgi:hypothetical protein